MSDAEAHNAIASVVAYYGRALERSEQKAAHFEAQWRSAVSQLAGSSLGADQRPHVRAEKLRQMADAVDEMAKADKASKGDLDRELFELSTQMHAVSAKMERTDRCGEPTGENTVCSLAVGHPGHHQLGEP